MPPKKFYESRQSAIELNEVKQQHPDDIGSVSSQSTDASFSQNRVSRQQEKQQLAGLNDRLASYIERVRHLETENARLHVQIRDVELVERREKENETVHYENKLSEIRNQLEVVSREKAKMELEHAKATSEYTNLKTTIAKLKAELDNAKKHVEDSDHSILDLVSRLNAKEKALHAMGADIAESKKKLEEQKSSMGVLRSQLESEVLLKSELERKVAAFKDELDFVRKNHNSQIEEFRRKRQSEMNVFSSEVENRYQAKLQEQLQSMRADFDARIAQSRAEIDSKYKNKLAEATDSAAKNRSAATKAHEEAAHYRSVVHDLETRNAGHNSVVNELKERIAELEIHLNDARQSTEIQLQHRDERIMALENEINSMLTEYQDLMDVKVQLDTELQAYQKLLEGEEQRLRIKPVVHHNLSQESAQNVSLSDDSLPGVIQPTIRRVAKRRRVENWESFESERVEDGFKISIHSHGEVIIEQVDVHGSFIRLLNRSDGRVSLGEWIVRSTAGDKEITFKFGKRMSIMENSTVTIWSNNAEQKIADPPQHLAMKNQAWPVGDVITAELVSNLEEVVGWYKCSK